MKETHFAVSPSLFQILFPVTKNDFKDAGTILLWLEIMKNNRNYIKNGGLAKRWS